MQNLGILDLGRCQKAEGKRKERNDSYHAMSSNLRPDGEKKGKDEEV